jgi:hypothetical protein
MSENKGITEESFVSEILVLMSKDCYPMEHFTLIPLDGAYEGEYTPALINYQFECVFVDDNKGYKSRGTAMKRLGDLWTIAERMSAIFETKEYHMASQLDSDAAYLNAFKMAKGENS